MKKLACLLLIALMLFVAPALIGKVHAATPVSGLLTSNTTWGVLGSPYVFTGPVAVMQGVILTVEPGVAVDFGSQYLEVNGTFIARGTSTNQIHFNSNSLTGSNPQVEFMPSSAGWNNKLNSGCIVQDVIFDNVSIVATGCSPKIANNIFITPFWMAVYSKGGGSPIITGNVIQDVAIEGMSVGGYSIVANNLFNLTSGEATAIVAHDNAFVSNNEILGFYNGITSDGSSTVEGNVIENCVDDGMYISSASLNIQDNYIANCKFGVDFCGGNLEDNAIVDNDVGIQVQAFPISSQIDHNNIVGSTQNSVSLACSINVGASDNWWGTTDTKTITQSIYDFNDNFNLGKVTYLPLLTQPDAAAPSNANINLNAPIPTQSAFSPTPIPQQKTTSDASTSQGGPFSFPETWISQLATVVIAVLGISWAVVLGVIARRRLKCKSQG